VLPISPIGGNKGWSWTFSERFPIQQQLVLA